MLYFVNKLLKNARVYGLSLAFFLNLEYNKLVLYIH